MTSAYDPLRAASAVFALLMACVAFPSSAQNQPEAIVLPQGNNHAQALDRVRFLISNDTELDVDAAVASQADFQANTQEWIDFGEVDGSLWLLARVRNDSGSAGEWMIDIQRPFTDELRVEKLSADGSREVLLDVDHHTHFDERPVVSQYLIAPLRMEAGEEADILVGLRSSTGTWLPLTFATAERMRTAHMQEARFNWIINGAILALVIVALAMGRLVGWRLALGFAAYSALGALFVANNEGYLHRSVLPQAPWAYQPLNLVLLPLMAVAALQFSKLFANLPERRSQWARGITLFQLALVVLAFVAHLLWDNQAVRALVLAAIPLAALVYVAVGMSAWRARVLGGFPFLLGTLALALTIAFMAAVLAFPGSLALTVALDYFHATLLFEALAFFIAIVVRMLAIQRAEIEATREKLALAEALEQSRARYDAARDKAETMRSRLASTSHDLQQPMVALRQGLKRIADRDAEASGKLSAALDYLEAVTTSGLADSEPEEHPLAGEKPDEGMEDFPLSVVLNNCSAMFRNEAEAKGIELRLRSSDIQVRADPVALMRAVSNLVSNALKHAEASAILIAAQPRTDHVLIRVIDNGKGMSEAELSYLIEAYAKGDGSEGHGLGLALVHEFAALPGHDLTVRSTPGRGTGFALKVPRGG